MATLGPECSLHGPLSPRIFVAAAIIIAGVALITVAKNKKPQTIAPRQAAAVVTPASPRAVPATEKAG